MGWKKIREKLKELDPMFGPSSRTGHDDRGAKERDADYRRSDSSERLRRNDDGRYGVCLLLYLLLASHL